MAKPISCFFFVLFGKRLVIERRGGERMCHFLKPLKLTQELSQKMSYSSELWYGSCFYDVYSGTAKKRRRNRRYRRKPPSAAEFFFCHFSLNYTFLNHLSPNYFFQKNYPNIFAFDTCNISNILLFNQKNHKCSVQMLG